MLAAHGQTQAKKQLGDRFANIDFRLTGAALVKRDRHFGKRCAGAMQMPQDFFEVGISGRSDVRQIDFSAARRRDTRETRRSYRESAAAARTGSGRFIQRLKTFGDGAASLRSRRPRNTANRSRHRHFRWRAPTRQIARIVAPVGVHRDEHVVRLVECETALRPASRNQDLVCRADEGIAAAVRFAPARRTSGRCRRASCRR